MGLGCNWHDTELLSTILCIHHTNNDLWHQPSIHPQTKVEELKLHNEYQLKLKEMNYTEKLKEATDKYMHELEQSKTKLELLKEEWV